ncbi:hypothetical protein SDC9_130266 [bioreactor metagenome]|uniref:Uncharacterized protein n=1 Tax=bioreactor metagenome TaxID=1076179 RepID=A0A645D258_9ZZZZ
MNADRNFSALYRFKLKKRIIILVGIIDKIIIFSLIVDNVHFSADIAVKTIVMIQMLWIDIGQYGNVRRAFGELQLMGGHFNDCNRFV